ncbi:MAG: M12 family metallo-peptidase [Planctomycetota bacterium]|jgi:PKD repeat protein|nr:M12 family metallo-peptidase [Planctomycetota bacterium]
MGIRLLFVAARPLALLVGFALLAPTALFAQGGMGVSQESLGDRVNRVLDLESSTVFSLNVSGNPGEPIRATVPLHGIQFTLDLAPHSVRSTTDYRVHVQDNDGRFVDVASSPVRTLRGTVEGFPESLVAATFDDDRGLYARIRLGDTGEEFWIEQLSDKMDGVAPQMHVAYSGDAVNSSEGQCGTTGLPAVDLDLDHGHGGKELGSAPACGVGLCLAQLGCDADFEYYQDNGSSVANVENKINSVINAMNLQYEADVDIEHVITSIVVRTSSGSDPYNSSSISGLLSLVRSQWQGPLSSIPHDTAQLFTGTNLSGSVIGVAWLSGVCGNLRYSVVENFSTNFACTTDLSAHELGHNWGAGHCTCSGFTMNPSITCANKFSSGSISSITNHRDNVGCLNGGGPPAADFTADKVTGGAPLAVRFSDASDGAYTDWLWTFGDGGTSTDAEPSHTYGSLGDYDVSLTVSGPAGSDTMTKSDFIVVTNTVVEFADLGGGTPWTLGAIVPHLEASSTLEAGGPFDLFMQSAPPSAAALAWVSFASTPLNVLGGTVWSNPPAFQLFFMTTFLGGLSLSTDWPAGLASGVDVYIQFLCQSSEATGGISFSNGITTTVP